jgi:hypothetical protein
MSFIHSNAFQNELKLALNTNEYIVVCDFAENYFFVLQDVQSFHWNNAQATIHPFVIYRVSGRISANNKIIYFLN